MRVALLVVVAVSTSGCYVGMRAGPAYQRLNGVEFQDTGVEWDVTAGIEVYTDDFAVLNPLAGKNRVAIGGGGMVSEVEPAVGPSGARLAPGAPIEASAGGGIMTIELGRTLAQGVFEGTDRDPTSGVLLRLATVGGLGEGSIRVGHADGSVQGGTAHLVMIGGGLEAGIHGGGARMHGGGVFIGGGVRYSRISGPDAVLESVSPYVSLTFEGGALLRILGEALKGGALACR
jgi:hypothetical protein